MAAADKYPTVAPDADTLKYFKANPTVSGMAVGAGLNGYDGPRRVMVNPYAKLNPQQTKALEENERLRHYMDETKPSLDFKITPKQLKAFEGTEYGKPENIDRLRETILARIITGDGSAEDFTEEQAAAAAKIRGQFDAPAEQAPSRIISRADAKTARANRQSATEPTYETKLSPEREKQFQVWLDQQHKAGAITDGDYKFYKENGRGYDYDFRAAFDKDLKPGKNGHWSDLGKKPNHPTFSTESKYNGVDGHKGGTWNGENFTPAQPNGKTTQPAPQSPQSPQPQPTTTMGRLLDRYDQMQRRPFGTNTALTDGTQNGVGGAAGSQFRRQEQAYGQALRLLSRKARRGDVNAALNAIRVRDQAMEDGYSVGGIRDKEQADAGIQGRVESMNERNVNIERRNTDLGTAGDITRRQAGEGLTEGATPIGGSREGGGDVNASDITASMSFEEAEREKRRLGTMVGNYGEGARQNLEDETTRASSLLDRAERRRKKYGNIA